MRCRLGGVSIMRGVFMKWRLAWDVMMMIAEAAVNPPKTESEIKLTTKSSRKTAMDICINPTIRLRSMVV